MYLSKLFLVSICVYTSIANASVLAKRFTCNAFTNGQEACVDSNGYCVATPSCHNHCFWYTCHCSAGTGICGGCIE